MRISIDTPVYFFTSVAHKRLPIFQTDKLKKIMVDALGEARRSGNFLIFAYVVMPDHYHILTDNCREPSDTLRYLNGISAKRILDHLKANAISSIEKLKMFEKRRGYKVFSLGASLGYIFGNKRIDDDAESELHSLQSSESRFRGAPG